MKKIIWAVMGIFLSCFISQAYSQQVSTDIKSMLSSEGKVYYGSEPNSLIVMDYPENVQSVTDYLNTIDVAPQQVLIEARVVEVKLQKEHALGVNWKAFADKGYLPVGRFKVGAGAIGTLPGPLNQTIPYKNTHYPPTDTSATSLENPFSVAIFDDNISVVLQTLASAMDTNILSAPRITTINNRQAEIKVIQSLPWAEPSLTADDAGNVTLTWTVNWEEVGIILNVTPTINDDGKIVLDLKPEVSEHVDDLELKTVAQGTELTYTVPIIDRRSAFTKVIIGDRQTLIIGGLIKDKIVKGESKVPFLGDIPGLGYLFKSTNETRDKTELLIFVSPTVITPDGFVQMAKQEKYYYGKTYLEERENKELLMLEREALDEKHKEHTITQLDSLDKKLSQLVAERKKLEADIRGQNQNLRTLEDLKRIETQKRETLEKSGAQ